MHHIALMVMYWLHLDSEGLMWYGRHGVELFFVISGFVLAAPFAKSAIGGGKQVSVKKYFVRRLTRLEIPYLLSLLILFLIKIYVRPQQAM